MDERYKISGNNDMDGVGAEYSRRQGLTAYRRGSSGSWRTFAEKTEVDMNVGDWVTYTILAEEFDKVYGSGVNLRDIQNTVDNEAAGSSDQLQVGESIQIARSMWIVRSRTPNHIEFYQDGEGKYYPERQDIYLECVERFGVARLTFMSLELLSKGNTLNKGGGFNNTNHVGISASPLFFSSHAMVRTVRPADVVEIGLKSRVYLRLNGLCNFAEVPTKDELEEFDDDDVNLSNGVINQDVVRSSYFTVYIRPIEKVNGVMAEWAGLGEQFVVRGRKPVDQFNYIRVYMPEDSKRYEIRLIPMPGHCVVTYFGNTGIVHGAGLFS